MKLKITLYSVCLLMLLAACQQDGPTPEPSVGSRTVLVYMIAQNSLAPLASADIEEMKEGIEFAHAHDCKVYVTANILAHNYDLDGARQYFKELKQIGPDALIISDPGMFTIAKEELPDIDIHISTQANNTNYMTYQFWWK